jgi:hypothetical protein
MTPESLVERVSFRDVDHSYHLDGKRIPSVTTILGNLSKPGLPSWAARVGAEAVRDLILDLDLSVVEDWNETSLEQFAAEAYDLARSSHNRIKNRAGAKGSIVHDAVQRYHEDFFTAEPPDAEAEPHAAAAWEAFIAWWSTSGLACVSTERKIVSADGTYAGRLDMLCEDEDGYLYVCDIKTSNGIHPEHVYQNAGYAKAISDELERNVEGTKVIWLPAGCTKATIIERDRHEWRDDYEVFEACLRIHRSRKVLDRWLLSIKEEHGPIPF